jgi:MFS family permease
MHLHHRQTRHTGHFRHSVMHARRHRSTRLGPDFAKLWGAGVSSNLADGMTAAALPLLAAVLTRDAFAVALVTALHSLPWIVFELAAGEIVDRSDRRRLMLFGNIARAVGISIIGLLVATDAIELWSLGAIAFGLGVAETLVDTSWEALVPKLVKPEDLALANGRTQAAEWTADELIGPPLGAALFALAAAAPFIVNGGVFVTAALLVALIPGRFTTDREVAHGFAAMRKDIGEGIRWLWQHPVLRSLSLTAGTANLMGTAMFAVFVLFAQEILDVDEVGYGLILAAAGVGGIVGASLAHRLEARLGPGGVLLGSMSGIAFVALAIATTNSPFVVGAAFAFDGFLIAAWNVTVVSLRQELTPDEMRGRVASDARTIAFGAIPVGAVLGGVLAEVIGLRAPFYIAAGVYAVAVLLMATVVSNANIAALREEAAPAG